MREQSVIATQSVGDQTYFVADLPLAERSAPRAAPRRIALLWDTSGSGARRDHEREFALLDAYFKALRQVEVSLAMGRDTVEPPRRFVVQDGRWAELRQVLASAAYDGASNLSSLVAMASGDVALLFSDGLANWGGSGIAAPGMPLYAISAAGSLDAARLRALSERSGGQWLDRRLHLS